MAGLIKAYNKNNRVSGNSISLDESRAIQFLAKRCEGVVREVRLSWSVEKVAYSAITMKTLSSAFLDDSKELPVKADNEIWRQVLKPSEDKYKVFVRRSRLRFEAKVADTLSKGKEPNTRAPGADYRDKDQ